MTNKIYDMFIEETGFSNIRNPEHQPAFSWWLHNKYADNIITKEDANIAIRFYNQKAKEEFND